MLDGRTLGDGVIEGSVLSRGVGATLSDGSMEGSALLSDFEDFFPSFMDMDVLLDIESLSFFPDFDMDPLPDIELLSFFPDIDMDPPFIDDEEDIMPMAIPIGLPMPIIPFLCRSRASSEVGSRSTSSLLDKRGAFTLPIFCTKGLDCVLRLLFHSEAALP